MVRLFTHFSPFFDGLISKLLVTFQFVLNKLQVHSIKIKVVKCATCKRADKWVEEQRGICSHAQKHYIETAEKEKNT